MANVVIEGLHIDIETEELRGLLEGRLGYHRERVKYYEKRIELSLKTDAELEDEAERLGKTSNQSPLQADRDHMKKHKDQVIYYDFVSKHLVSNATYRLEESDLVRLGIKSDRFY